MAKKQVAVFADWAIETSQAYLLKAKEEPWECNARDVVELAKYLQSLAEKYNEMEEKFFQYLEESIKHTDAMSQNILSLALKMDEKDLSDALSQLQ